MRNNNLLSVLFEMTKWPAMRSRQLDIGHVLCCTSIDQDYILGVGGGGGYTGFQGTGMIKWGQKSQSKKKFLDQQLLTPKISHAGFPSLKKFPESITW